MLKSLWDLQTFWPRLICPLSEICCQTKKLQVVLFYSMIRKLAETNPRSIYFANWLKILFHLHFITTRWQKITNFFSQNAFNLITVYSEVRVQKKSYFKTWQHIHICILYYYWNKIHLSFFVVRLVLCVSLTGPSDLFDPELLISTFQKVNRLTKFIRFCV